MKNKSAILALPFLLFASTSLNLMAQNEGSVVTATGRGSIATSTVTDYQALNINPANLGLKDGPTFSFGLAELNLSLYSSALNSLDFKMLRQDPQGFSQQYNNAQIAQKFAGARNSFDFNLMPLGLSFMIPKVGGFALSIRQNISFTSYMNSGLSNLLFNGFHYTDYIDTFIVIPGGDTIGLASNPISASQLFDSSRISFSATTDINFGYGRELYSNDNLSIYGGIGLQYIIGWAMIDAGAKDNTLKAVSAFTPLIDISFSSVPNPSLDTSGQLVPAGKGFGIDLGTTLKTGIFSAGISLTQLGSIKWKSNVYQIADFTIDTVDFTGLDSTMFNSNINLVSMSGAALVKEALPTKLHLGLSVEPIENLRAGLDLTIPLNDAAGNLSKPYLGLGGEYTLFNFLTVSSGVTMGGNYRVNVPFGIRIFIGKNQKGYEFALATRDITTFLGAKRPNLSIGLAALRFKF